MGNIFEHQSMEYDKDYKYVISPSRMGKLYDKPNEWYRETVLHESGFEGNTASMIGSICHYIYKCFTESKGEVDKDRIHERVEGDMREYLMNHAIECDVEAVLDIYPKVCNVVLNDYVRRYRDVDCVCERGYYTRLREDIVLAGTMDRYEYVDGIICDYKTVGTKPNLEKLPIGYRLQLMSYWKILHDNGTEAKKLRIIYGVKPSIRLEARCFVVEEDITDAYCKQIEYICKNICDSISICDKHPEMSRLIFRGVNDYAYDKGD